VGVWELGQYLNGRRKGRKKSILKIIINFAFVKKQETDGRK
jgi:hypothetical protein